MFFTALRFRWVDETTDKQTNYDQLLSQTQQLGILDDNIDGKVQMAELKGGVGNQLRPMFAVIDANKDGGLDQNELMAANAAARQRRSASN